MDLFRYCGNNIFKTYLKLRLLVKLQVSLESETVDDMSTLARVNLIMVVVSSYLEYHQKVLRYKTRIPS